MLSLNDFIGKEVQLYPGDTDKKFGIIEEISDKGYIIRITKADRPYGGQTFKVGEIHFISLSSKFSFKVSSTDSQICSKSKGTC